MKTMIIPFRRSSTENSSKPAIVHHLRSLTTKTTGKLNVLGLDGDTLGMDGTQVGIFEERDEVSLDGLLESTDGR